jgi:shikimate kinase
VARAVLIGLPGCGKTTVGRSLAHAWGCDVVDTDELLSASVSMPAAQYLRSHGEDEFRSREVAALADALAGDVVVSTGGGIVVSTAARDMLRREPTVWLDCEDAALLARLDDSDRPLLGDEPAVALARLRREREAWYDEVARVRVDASGDVEDVVGRVRDALGVER